MTKVDPRAVRVNQGWMHIQIKRLEPFRPPPSRSTTAFTLVLSLSDKLIWNISIFNNSIELFLDIFYHLGSEIALANPASNYEKCIYSLTIDLGGLKETKNVSSPSTCESQYCGEPP